MNRELVGERIRKYRKERRLTQERCAERCDLSTNFIGIIERGEKRPSLDTFINIANALDVSADMLLEDELNHLPDEMPFAAEIQSLPEEGRRFVRNVTTCAVQFVKEVGAKNGGYK